MQKRLDGKVAIITGGSRGIGAAIARRLAAEGARVVINYASGEAAAREVVAQIESAGGQAFAVQGDLTRLEAAAALVEAALARYGRLDLLVNNAAVVLMKRLGTITPEDYTRQMDLNVRAPLFLSQQAAPHMQAGGRIINISSGAAQGALPGAAVYSASKAALEALTRVMAYELGPRGITVNTVAPGPVLTEMMRGALTDSMRSDMLQRTPLGRIAEPEDIAAVVAFVASEDGRWVTGQTIGANGGMRS